MGPQIGSKLERPVAIYGGRLESVPPDTLCMSCGRKGDSLGIVAEGQDAPRCRGMHPQDPQVAVVGKPPRPQGARKGSRIYPQELLLIHIIGWSYPQEGVENRS